MPPAAMTLAGRRVHGLSGLIRPNDPDGIDGGGSEGKGSEDANDYLLLCGFNTADIIRLKMLLPGVPVLVLVVRYFGNIDYGHAHTTQDQHGNADGSQYTQNKKTNADAHEKAGSHNGLIFRMV